MKTSTDRILTTHVGSLPRPQDVVDLLFAQDRGESYDEAQFEETMRRAVGDAIRKQQECGVDVVSDGEMSKISYATYIRHRLTGFEGDSARPTPQDLDDFPEYRDRLVKAGHSATYKRPVCKGPIKVKNLKPVEQDIARMKDALAKANVVEGFMNAVSPGTIAVFQPNEYYPSHEKYLEALADAMREEYEMIVKSGLLLQLDCPDLAMGRHSRFKNLSDEEFLRYAELQVEALNHALANVPADRVRLHVCWGNYEGTHINDMDCMKIFPIAVKVKPRALLIEGANPRHEHEWEAWTKIKLPEGKILVPGVVAASTNYVEHPQVVAQRILRYANVVGRERVMAGTDCGFGTFAGFGPVYPAFAWMKLKSLAEGARIASQKLWGRASTTN
ncbi:MAG TPA: cobalamin-independent methionine synthase II family protein [Candidatus Baltobacteraceae bacterium]|nr:cobalamin-independent methionine synthase II family protein [Candidatus Baltobacteraceae bacterium]